MGVAGNVLGGDDELIPRSEADRAAGEFPEADLRSLEVGENADATAGHVGAGPHAAVCHQVVGLVAMAHVEPGDVHAGGDQRGDLLLA